MNPPWIRTDLLEQISRVRPRDQDLPAYPGEEPSERDRPDEQSPDASAVLVVEDDADIAGMYALGLQLGGHAVRVASTGRSALIDVAEKQPQAIVLDLWLPDIAGLEMIDSLRHAPKTEHVPIIVLSNEDAEFPEAYQRGANECHLKYRTTPKELVHYVEGAIGAAG
jgi:CheY-like chemotaxis protein